MSINGAVQLREFRQMTPVAAPPDQHDAVVQLVKFFVKVAPSRRKRCELLGPNGERIALPETIFYALERVAEVLANGDAITVVPVGKELTTQQAADLLNISRQYLVRLLDEGKIPFTKPRTHRRLRIEDVIAYRKERDGERRAKLDELTALSEEFGAYPELE